MVARNYCLMKLRKQPAKTPAAITENMGTVDEEAGENYLEKEQLLELMADSLQELNPEQKRCVTLFYLDKKSYQEIADSTGFTLMQVKSHIQNGKRNLKLLLDKKLNKAHH
jgi:RNA polymerase sigma-70 factor (ECF subfamily)